MTPPDSRCSPKQTFSGGQGGGERRPAPAILTSLALLLGLLAPARAAAACDASLSMVDFGRVEFRRDNEITGRVTVTCSEPGPFQVSASAGNGDFRERVMRGPMGDELRYNLYVDAARRRVWGDGIAGGTARIAGTSDGRRPETFTVYGKLPAGQAVAAGGYRDSVQVTVER
jgi:spore coat protein U-like protein